PIGNLAAAISSPAVFGDADEASLPTSIAIHDATLRRSSNGLVEAYKQSGIDNKANVLILVDQFEELFRFNKIETEAREGKRDAVAFVNLLIKAARQTEYPIYVVFTMRSDFLSDCTEFRGLPEAINDGDYLVPRMTREERREAITGPIAVANGKISQRLLNQLLNDVGDNPDQLPILQHALMRTWDIWKKKNQPDSELDLEDYEQIGTMQHALSQHAEEAYGELESDNQRRICEVIFKSLTDKGSDTRGIRRPSSMAELCQIANAGFTEVAQVVEVFRKTGRAFLMPPARVPLTEHSIIDISHESLMRVWERLIAWVEEENQSAQIYWRLCEAADLYEQGKGGLWRDPELQVAWKWKEEQQPNAIWASRYNQQFDKAILFLEHSKKTFELDRIHKENLQKKRLRQARRITIVISAIAVLALFLSIYSFEQKNQAEKSRKQAEAARIRAQQQEKIALEQKRIAEVNKAIALQEKTKAEQSREQAVLQKEIAEKERKNAEENRKDALLQKTIAENQKAYAERQRQAAEESEKVAKQQQAIAVEQKDIATKNEQIAIAEKKVSTRLQELAESRNLAYQSLLLLNDNNTAGSRDLVEKAYEMNARNNGPIQNSDIFNALHFNWEQSIQQKNQFLLHKFPVRAITGIPGTDFILSGDEGGALVLSRADKGILQPLTRIALNDEIRHLSLTPDGSRLLVLSAKGNGYLYAVDAGKQVLAQLSRFSFPGTGKTAVFTDANTGWILSGEGITGIRLTGNQVLVTKNIPGTDFGAMTLAHDGSLYIGKGNQLLVYPRNTDPTGEPSRKYTITGRITSIAIDPGERYLAAGTAEGGVWLTSTDASAKPVQMTLHLSAVNDIRFNTSPDHILQLASAGADQAIKVLDVRATLAGNSNEDVLVLKGHHLWVYGLWFTPDGKYLFSSSEDQKIIGWIPSMSAIYDLLKKAK
ncbi:MAG TPA: hypothetical protein VG842_02165, partial [Sediminibacterium sp.]|nr:hypothetical protein [Sediminibacterium sp.]